MSTSKKRSGLARLWQLAFTYKVLILLACVCSVLGVIASFLPFIAIYYIVQELVGSLSNNTTINGSLMISYGWLAFLSAASAILLNFLALIFSHIAAFKTLYQLKYNFICHIAYLPLGFHERNASGKLRKIIDENIEKIEQFIAHQLPDIVGTFAAPITVLVILVIFDWRLGMATLVPIIFAYIAILTAYRRKDAKNIMPEFLASLDEMSNASVEYIRGISVIKAFNQTVFSLHKFNDAIRSYQIISVKFTRCFENHMAVFLLLLNHIYLFLVPVIILLSGYVDNYSDFALAVIFYLIFTASLATPFMKLMYVSNGMRQLTSSVEQMDTILAVGPLLEPTQPQTTSHYDVSFDHVTFSYQSADDDNAIENISFLAKQGKVTALVGASGSGKSTAALLIPRFFDPQQGTIKIGGIDIRQMSSDYLLLLTSFVFQDVFLFKQSIMDNIRIGRPDASQDEVIAAAKSAQCHEFISRLPQGYATVIGSQGIHLSGGEKQRLAVARAILKNAPILVLDEATAFADPENEYKIQLAFKALVQHKTVIMIAHRLSTIKEADQIIVLDKGHIIEQGKHQDLITRQGRYYQMWQAYSQTLGWHIKATKEQENV